MTRLASLVLVVRDLERALALWEQALGFARVDEPSEVPGLGARHVYLRAENCLLELVQPDDERSPPGRFLEQRGEGMFAMELCLDDPAAAREHLAHARVPTPGAAGRWYVRPADAHGMLVAVAPAGAPDPAS
jgi:catechol 2,3-dioxygenase-like lactoylglutathione lyase family enzyme